MLSIKPIFYKVRLLHQTELYSESRDPLRKLSGFRTLNRSVTIIKGKGRKVHRWDQASESP